MAVYAKNLISKPSLQNLMLDGMHFFALTSWERGDSTALPSSVQEGITPVTRGKQNGEELLFNNPGGALHLGRISI